MKATALPFTLAKEASKKALAKLSYSELNGIPYGHFLAILPITGNCGQIAFELEPAVYLLPNCLVDWLKLAKWASVEAFPVGDRLKLNFLCGNSRLSIMARACPVNQECRANLGVIRFGSELTINLSKPEKKAKLSCYCFRTLADKIPVKVSGEVVSKLGDCPVIVWKENVIVISPDGFGARANFEGKGLEWAISKLNSDPAGFLKASEDLWEKCRAAHYGLSKEERAA